MGKNILTINGGSSSIKFALYSGSDSFTRTLHGSIYRIGLSDAKLIYTKINGEVISQDIVVNNARSAVEILDSFLSENINLSEVVAVGHRIVHGMNRANHAIVSSELIAELKEISPIDPEHLPLEIAILEMFASKYPSLTQVACFDTVFHHDMPRVAQILPIPRRFDAKGIRRYGFHGLSLDYIMEEMKKIDPERAKGKVIIAHLGSGASITAIKEGKSVDTSMGFTPTGGIPMSSRTGDFDPGALLYLMKSEGLSLGAIGNLINHEAGLLGVSATSSDMHDLLDHEESDERAREAVNLFCYEAKKRIGSYAAALGGVETLIFTGGIGENSAVIRQRICVDLEFLGITIDEEQNQNNREVISPPSALVLVRVIPTNEEHMIARIAYKLANK